VRGTVRIPEHGVQTAEIREIGINQETRTLTRCADGLAVIIDGKDNTIRITGDGGQFLHPPVLPNDRLELELLKLE
jgi:hypothetical protein